MTKKHNDQLPESEASVEKDTEDLDGEGLSLDKLSEAYADALETGEDPFQDPADEKTEDTLSEEVESAGSNGSCEISPRSILEAMLFVGHPTNEPLTSKLVASLMRGVRPQEIDDLVLQLNELYDSQHAPYVIESVGAGYRMVLREEFSPLQNKFYSRVKDAKLSQAAIDILAIVAYKQPLDRQQIDKYRDKDSSRLLRQLVRRDLLRLDRSDDKAAKVQYGTTDRFLNLFGLDGIDDLPQSQDLDKSL